LPRLQDGGGPRFERLSRNDIGFTSRQLHTTSGSKQMKLERLTLLVVARPLVVIFGLLLAASAMYSAATETYYYFVFSNPVAGHEDEYNKWYNEQHAPDVVAVPGFVTKKRILARTE
jgi:hypothetical protein